MGRNKDLSAQVEDKHMRLQDSLTHSQNLSERLQILNPGL